MIKNLLLIFMLSIAQIQIAWADYDSDLIYAAKDGDLNKVKSLISKGADVNAKNKYGYTALNKAKTSEIRQFLINNGAREWENMGFGVELHSIIAMAFVKARSNDDWVAQHFVIARRLSECENNEAIY